MYAIWWEIQCQMKWGINQPTQQSTGNQERCNFEMLILSGGLPGGLIQIDATKTMQSEDDATIITLEGKGKGSTNGFNSKTIRKSNAIATKAKAKKMKSNASAKDPKSDPERRNSAIILEFRKMPLPQPKTPPFAFETHGRTF